MANLRTDALDDVRTGDVPVFGGVVAGIAAYLLGYLVVYAATITRLRESPLGALVGDQAWQAVAWVFYSAHFVDTVGQFSALGLTVTRSVNWIANADSNFSAALYLVPIVLLLAAGAIVARRSVATVGDAVVAGLAVVPSYFLLAVAGALATTVSEGSAAVGPDPVLAAFLAGLVYPALFAVAGAVAATRLG